MRGTVTVEDRREGNVLRRSIRFVGSIFGGTLGPQLLGDPRLQAASPDPCSLVQPCVAGAHREAVGRSVAAWRSSRRRARRDRMDVAAAAALGVGGHGHGRRSSGQRSRTRAPARTCSSRRFLISSTSACTSASVAISRLRSRRSTRAMSGFSPSLKISSRRSFA